MQKREPRVVLEFIPAPNAEQRLRRAYSLLLRAATSGGTTDDYGDRTGNATSAPQKHGETAATDAGEG